MFKTQIIPCESANAIELANGSLKHSEAIVTPTDTVYGIMAMYMQPSAIQTIYTIKERPRSKAIPVLIGHTDQIEQIAQFPRDKSKYRIMQNLIDTWWPGALTLILPARAGLPTELTAGQKTVAVRLPDHDWLRHLIKAAGPLAATSANLSGQEEATDAESAMSQLAGRVPLIFDGGQCKGGISSTIIDLAGEADTPPQIVRSGPLAGMVSKML